MFFNGYGVEQKKNKLEKNGDINKCWPNVTVSKYVSYQDTSITFLSSPRYEICVIAPWMGGLLIEVSHQSIRLYLPCFV